ncbi:hypothetical protein [Mycobacterium servetii]|uniref:Uncharacterized protein n=1 Tax=Mycobacterium servetii TaxID=3237418 RepID=A0ABV4C1B4_9MYCO
MAASKTTAAADNFDELRMVVGGQDLSPDSWIPSSVVTGITVDVNEMPGAATQPSGVLDRLAKSGAKSAAAVS